MARQSNGGTAPGPPLSFSAEHLRWGWILLGNGRVGTVQVPIVFMREQTGVALFELEPHWTADMVETFRRQLDVGGFTAAYPGYLPVIHRRLRPDDVPHLGVILREGFAFQDGISLPPGGAWCAALQRLLTPPLAASAVPAPPAEVRRRRWPRLALASLAVLPLLALPPARPGLFSAPPPSEAGPTQPTSAATQAAAIFDIVAATEAGVPPPDDPPGAGVTLGQAMPEATTVPPAEAVRGFVPVAMVALSADIPLEAAVPPPPAIVVTAVAPPPPIPSQPPPETLVVAIEPPADAAVTAALLRRGTTLLALGDISGARRFLERADGSAEAAWLLAQTYDPHTPVTLNTYGLRPDPQAALHWYRRAAALGATTVGRSIALLERRP